jgi:hypothetical protein
MSAKHDRNSVFVKSVVFASPAASSAGMALCAAPTPGQCLKGHLETQYRPAGVFLGGGAGYAHEYVPSDESVYTRWKTP